MALSRRAFIRVAGGAAVFAAAGVGLSPCDRMPAEAISGWNGPPAAETEPRRRALSFALLAPNPHNMQSWIADLSTPGEIALFVDPARLLPETDPQWRQILIGCGCFLETLTLAAAAEGWRADAAVVPDGFDESQAGARPFAVVRFIAAVPADPDGLAAAIVSRRSGKVDYDGRAVPPEAIAALRRVHRADEGALTLTSDPEAVAALRRISTAAMRVEVDTDRTYAETVRVMRIGADEIAAHRDGLSFHGPFFWWAKALGLLSPEAQMDKDSTARGMARALLDDQAASTATFGWLTTTGNTRAQQIGVGRAYVRQNLAATRAGLAFAPWSQALQEFPEMAALRAELRAVVGAAAGDTVQMFFRLGYASPPPPPPTPRRALDAIIAA